MILVNKRQRFEKDLYDVYTTLSPQKIRKIVRKNLKEKIKYENFNGKNEYQGKVLASCLKVNPSAYLMGYLDTLEKVLSENNHDIMDKIVLNPQVKSDFATYGRKHTAVMITVVGSVYSADIRELIEIARKNDSSREELIKSLEALMDEALDKDLNRSELRDPNGV